MSPVRTPSCWRSSRILCVVLVYRAAAFDVQRSGAAAAPNVTGSWATAWRLINAGVIEEAWQVRSLQLFTDDACTKHIFGEPGHTGEAFGTEASDMTGAEHVFALRSMRGWESIYGCAPGECHIGFAFKDPQEEVRCLLVQQGDTGLHADAITLQKKE